MTLAISASSFASINPNNELIPLFKVFGEARPINNTEVSVEGPSFSLRRDRLSKGGEWVTVPQSFYDEVQHIAEGVFRARPNKARGQHTLAYGSAFHVGGNLVLTAHHVIDINQTRTQCRKFKIELNDNQNEATLHCEKVLHCNSTLDYCLVEMENNSRGYSLEKQVPLILNSDKIVNSRSSITTAIGNTQGFGLHASTGKGVYLIDNEIWFYATIFGGNSGGPVFNENNEVIGVVTKQTANLHSTEAANFATPISAIREDLIKTLGTDNELIKQINFK